MPKEIATMSPDDKFYDRRLSPWGHSRALAVGSILPKDWTIVRVRVGHQDAKRVVLHIEWLG